MPAHKKPRVQKNCVICGKQFECTPYRATFQVTCLSDECKKAIKHGEHNPFYGKSHSEESKAKVSKTKTLPRVEVICTCGCGETIELPMHRIKKSISNVFFVDQDHMHKWLVGENHPNYRGGNVYYGDGWHKVAKDVRERDRVCQMCGKTPQENGRALDVHHKVPVRVSKDNSMDNLIALCISCHQKLQVTEQFEHPYKVRKYRTCIVCSKIFIPEPFQKICSDECKRKRTREWEKKYLTNHPDKYQEYRQRIKKWQQVNKDRVNDLHQQSRLRRKNQ